LQAEGIGRAAGAGSETASRQGTQDTAQARRAETLLPDQRQFAGTCDQNREGQTVHAAKEVRHAHRPPPQVRPDDHVEALAQEVPQPCERDISERARPGLGERHYLFENRPGELLPQPCHRRIQQEDNGLRRSGQHGGCSDETGPKDGDREQDRPEPRADPPFGQGTAVLQRRICRTCPEEPYQDEHDRKWGPVRKCPGRKDEQDLKRGIRPGASDSDQITGQIIGRTGS